MLSVRLSMRRVSSILTHSIFFTGKKNKQAGLKCFLWLSILPWNEELPFRSQKCHKPELIRSLYILKIHKNAMSLLCVLRKCTCVKVRPCNFLLHLMSFVSFTNNLLAKVTRITTSCFHVPNRSRAKRLGRLKILKGNRRF